MPQHDLEITIGKDGQVKIHVKGVKGKGCLEYAKFFEKIVGRVEDQKQTSEFYEPEARTRIHLENTRDD